MNGACGSAALVSIIIPALNAERHIRSAIASVHRQTYRHYEIIVVDDGSTDSTATVAESLGAKVVRLSVNQGPSSARNAGIQVATGEYIALIDADDTWEPPFLEESLRTLVESNATLCFSSATLVDAGGRKVGIGYVRVPLPPTREQAFRKMIQADYIRTSSVVIRRKDLDRLADAPFDPRLRGSEDWDLWLRLLEYGAELAYVPGPLLNYRVHTDTYYSSTDMHRAQRKVLLKHYYRNWHLPAVQHWYTVSLARLETAEGLRLLRTGQWHSAINILRWAIARHPAALYHVLIYLRAWRVARSLLILVRPRHLAACRQQHKG